MRTITIQFRGNERRIQYEVKNDNVYYQFLETGLPHHNITNNEDTEIVGKCWDDYYSSQMNYKE